MLNNFIINNTLFLQLLAMPPAQRKMVTIFGLLSKYVVLKISSGSSTKPLKSTYMLLQMILLKTQKEGVSLHGQIYQPFLSHIQATGTKLQTGQ